MVINDRLVVDLADILAIQIKCKKCSTTVSFPPKNWDPGQLQCPNCKAWLWGGLKEAELEAIIHLANTLKGLLAESKNLNFCVQLQIEHPS